MAVGLVDEVGEVREMVDGGIFPPGGWGRGRMLLARDSDSVCVQNELSEEKYFCFKKGQQNAGQRCFYLLAIYIPYTL